MATLTGKTLGKYQVMERIGQGGMAEVYKGYHPLLDRNVAIKVLHSHLVEGEGLLARFEREARAAAALRHAHIVQVYDFDFEDEIFYMVMEYFDGGSLKAHLADVAGRGEYLSMLEIARELHQLGEALDYAHRQGMLHRDVKPSNVLLDLAGSVYLTDFGIARILGDSQLTTSGMLIGTPAYMSPEQGRGDPLSEASDIYSLGIILFEMLTGVVPFEADTPMGIIHKHIHAPLPLPSSVRTDLPKAVDSIVVKTLAKDPQERFPTATELATAFEKVLGVELGSSRPPRESEISAPVAPDADLMPTVVMGEAPSDEEGKATVVMDDLGPDENLKATVIMEEPSEQENEAFAAVDRGEAAMQAPKIRSKRNIGRILLLSAMGLAAVIVLLFLSGIFGQSDIRCASVGECQVQAAELMQNGEFADAIDYIDHALDLVSADEHPRNAQLWCNRAEALLTFGRIDDAIEDYTTCCEWTENLPEFEYLCIVSETQIHELRTR
jgi:serine/threonine protein kinase